MAHPFTLQGQRGLDGVDGPQGYPGIPGKDGLYCKCPVRTKEVYQPGASYAPAASKPSSYAKYAYQQPAYQPSTYSSPGSVPADSYSAGGQSRSSVGVPSAVYQPSSAGSGEYKVMRKSYGRVQMVNHEAIYPSSQDPRNFAKVIHVEPSSSGTQVREESWSGREQQQQQSSAQQPSAQVPASPQFRGDALGSSWPEDVASNKAFEAHQSPSVTPPQPQEAVTYGLEVEEFPAEWQNAFPERKKKTRLHSKI
ncbi:hypothetical protein AAVH_29060 [Aphelenchoides avenae]|nr:hypothetical protein AAVH_29060 [Aphelenchus avenae]